MNCWWELGFRLTLKRLKNTFPIIIWLPFFDDSIGKPLNLVSSIQHWFHHSTLLELNAHIIALILFAHFSECRPLLNQLNAGPNSLVRSFPCKNLRVGSREVMKPQDVQYEHLYIDFNLGPKLIRVSTRTTYKQT